MVRNTSTRIIEAYDQEIVEEMETKFLGEWMLKTIICFFFGHDSFGEHPWWGRPLCRRCEWDD